MSHVQPISRDSAGCGPYLATEAVQRPERITLVSAPGADTTPPAVRRADWDRRVRADEIGVSPSLAPSFGNVSVPFGALVPARLDGLLAPGRHLACDATSHSFLREIPQWS